MKKKHGALGILALGGAFAAVAAIAQTPNPGEAVGQHFQFLASNLAPPYATPASAERSTKAQEPAEANLKLPAGFHANLFASGLDNARWLQMTPNGDVLLAEAEAGKITLLRDADGDGKAEMKVTFADGFQRPHGMTFANRKFYVADALGIYSFPYKPGDTKVSGPRTQVTEQGAFGTLGGHWTRNLAADSKGNIYVAIGSAENIGEDPPHRAAVSMVQGSKLV